MSDPDFQQFQRIFEHAVDLPAEERAKYLDEACAGNEALRARVEELLAADAELEGFLEPPDGFGLPVNKLKEEATDFLPEEEIGGYQLLRELGRGGRGVVYLARDPKTDGLVALKVLGMGMLPSAVAVERFRREAKAVARLSHSGVVRLVKAGDDRTRPYLVMEYVEGHTLADEILLQRHAREGVELPEHLQGCAPMLPTSEPERFDAAVKLVCQLSEALGHAHDRGVLHRDVKPQNILLDKQGKPYLVDFGLAFVEGEQELTRTGDVEGTPNYMSPEQVRAERDRIDLRTDVYSLGVVLYELLTLRRPFDAPTANQVMQNITRTMPPRIRRVAPSVPDALELLCTTAIEKRRRDRCASMASLKADLEAYLHQRPLQARRPGALTRAKRAVDRRPMPYMATGVAIFALFLGGWAVSSLGRINALAEAERAIDEIATFTDAEFSLTRAMDAIANLPGGTSDLDSGRQEAYADGKRRGVQIAENRIAEAFRDPELETEGFSLAKNPIQLDSEDPSGQDWLSLGSSWGYDEAALASFLERAQSRHLVISLVGADWSSVDGVQLGVPRPDSLGTERWVDLESQFGDGVFPIDVELAAAVRLQFSDGRVRELSCLSIPLGHLRRLTIDVDRIDDLEWTLVAGASLALSHFFFPDVDPELQMEVAPFRMQTTPLSYAQYFAFADANGYSTETMVEGWPEGLKELVLSKPVGSVTLEEAASCAAWYGVRLPSAPEFQLAVRGPEMPYLPEGFDLEAHLQFMEQIPAPEADEAAWKSLPPGTVWQHEWLAKWLSPTDRNISSDLSASGIRMGHGGVFEYTTTIAGALGAGPLGALPVYGGSATGWEVDFSPNEDRNEWRGRLMRAEVGVPEVIRGFRCVAPME